MRPALFHGWQGLGDTIYYRPAVKAQVGHRKVYVETSWPELFADVNVSFVRPGVRYVGQDRNDVVVHHTSFRYRTQLKNILRQPVSLWSAPPPGAQKIMPRQSWGTGISIPEGVANSVDLMGEPYRLDLPPFPRPGLPRFRKLAVIRPVTHRKEWLNRARSPDPTYIAAAADQLRGLGYTVVSVADLESEEEWMEEPGPLADLTLHRGELVPSQLLGLVAHADLVVGGPGWIVPACLATRTRLVVVGGGDGFHNAPEKLMGPLVDSSRVRWILPDRYCRCRDPLHECDKGIDGFDERFASAVGELEALSVAPRKEKGEI